MNKLVWIDCEMTGLDPFNDRLLEVAIVITNQELQVLAQSRSYVIGQPLEVLEKMDQWNTMQHSKSGLWALALDSDETVESVQSKLLGFLRESGVAEKESPLCGNSVHQDRFFLRKWMPILEGYMHYRNIDVSTLKQVLPMWCPNLQVFQKREGEHRAIGDVLQSIAEIKYYQSYIKKLL